jgi:hypothetical protein
MFFGNAVRVYRLPLNHDGPRSMTKATGKL